MISDYELCFVCLHVEVWAIKVMKFVFCFVCQYWCRQKFSIIVFACFRQHQHYWFWIAFVPWVKTIDLFNFYDHIGNFQLSTIRIWCNLSLFTAIIYISCSLFRSFQNHDNKIPRPMLSILLGHYFLMNIRFSSCRFIVWPFLSAQQKELYKVGQVQITWLQVTIVPAGGEWDSSWCQFDIANTSNQMYLSFFWKTCNTKV